MLVWLDHGRVRLVTRRGHDWTERLPRLAARFRQLDAGAALLDGEMVALRSDGTTHFHDLQAALSEGLDGHLFYIAFDLLHLDGWDLRRCALRDRKRLLERAHEWGGYLRYADHVEGSAEALHQEACRLKLEGIICKRADSPYRAGRSATWLKVKCPGREDFAVLGWTPPSGHRQGIGALVLGFYDPEGRLHYAGAVGTGFSDKELLALRAGLEPLRLVQPPFLLAAGDPPDRNIHWIAPNLVAEVEFAGWSGEGRVRHPVFLGLREDQAASEVVMQVPDPEVRRREFRPVRVVSGKISRRPRRRGAVPPVRPE
jgi:bifunctional non-homologous end joining protein LigD